MSRAPSAACKLFESLILLGAALGMLGACTSPGKVDEERIEELNEVFDEALEREADDSERQQALARVDLLDRETPSVRAAIVANMPRLARLDRERMRARALEILRTDQEPYVRLECVRALTRLGGPEANKGLSEVLERLDQLTSLLVETNAEVRALAARGLGDLNRLAGVPALVTALTDPVLWVRTQAELSLIRIAGGRKARSVDEWRRWYDAARG